MCSWRPNYFLQTGENSNYNDEYLNNCLEIGNELDSRNLPVIFSLKHLSEIVDVPFNFLNQLVSREITPYRSFTIRKQGGRYRNIVAPNDNLLKVLRFIHQQILSKLNYHSSSKAYYKGSKIYDNAFTHCGSNWLIKLDITRFFESISEKQVYYTFRELGYPPRFCYELAKITTIVALSKRYNYKRWRNGSIRIGYLPQGYPTSPLLANRVCNKLDNELYEYARQNKYIYTRYSDDIVFSAVNCSRGKAVTDLKNINAILVSFGFSQNYRKTHIVPPGARKIITGLVVNGSTPTIKKDVKNRIRAQLFYINKYGIADVCRQLGFKSIIGYRNHLKGLINFVISIDKNIGSKYSIEFNRLLKREKIY